MSAPWGWAPEPGVAACPLLAGAGVVAGGVAGVDWADTEADKTNSKLGRIEIRTDEILIAGKNMWERYR